MELPSKRQVKKTVRKAVKAVRAKSKRAEKATRTDRKHLAKHLKLAARDAAETVRDAVKA